MTPSRRFDNPDADDEPGLIVDFPVLASWACAILAVVVVLAIGALR